MKSWLFSVKLDYKRGELRLTRTGSGGSRRGPKPVASRRGEPWLPRKKLSGEAIQALEALPRNQFVLPPGAAFTDVIQRPGHLDLFSGCRGAAKALARRTGKWVLCFDLKHSSAEDLLDESNQAKLDSLLALGAFCTMTAGPVCSSFSRPVRPAVRTSSQPRGVNEMSANNAEKVAIGNAMSQWLAAFTRRCLLAELIIWIENPAMSFLWQQPEWLQLQSEFSLEFFTADYCGFWDALEEADTFPHKQRPSRSEEPMQLQATALATSRLQLSPQMQLDKSRRTIPFQAIRSFS